MPQKKQNNKHLSTGSVIAGIAGAVAVTGVAVAATIALKDKKTRDKVKNALSGVKDQAMDYMEDAQDRLREEVKKI